MNHGGKKNKSDVKFRNTLGYLDQYICRSLRLWNSQDCEAMLECMYVQRMEPLKQPGPFSNLGSHSYYVLYSSCCPYTLVVITPKQ